MTLLLDEQAPAGPAADVPTRAGAQRDRASLRPTSRAVLVFSAGIPLAFLMLAWSRGLWPVSFVFALLVLAAMAADALLILRRAHIGLNVSAPPHLAIGERGQVRVDIATLPDTRPTALTMLLEQAGPAELPVAAQAPTADGRLAVGLFLTATRRGRIELEALWLRWAGPFGLVACRWRHPLGLMIDVLPKARGLRDAALDLAIEGRLGTKAQRQRGEGSEFEMLREHVAGLDNRHVDWKRSARHNKLLSRAFRTERNHQIVLAFDTGHLMLEPVEGKTRLDHAIEAGLTLGWVSLKSEDLVGVFAFDAAVRLYLAPGAGLGYLARVQAAAARLDYTSEETNFTAALAALNQRLKRRALVVLFTEFVDTVSAELLLEAAKRMTSRHVLIFVTLRDPTLARLVDAEPTGFLPVARSIVAHDLLRDRAVVLERLARLGVHVLDVPVGALTSRLVNTYLLIKQRGAL